MLSLGLAGARALRVPSDLVLLGRPARLLPGSRERADESHRGGRNPRARDVQQSKPEKALWHGSPIRASDKMNRAIRGPAGLSRIVLDRNCDRMALFSLFDRQDIEPIG